MTTSFAQTCDDRGAGENGVFIRDAGLAHKFMVNDQELSEAQLKHNDLIVVGKTRSSSSRFRPGLTHTRAAGGHPTPDDRRGGAGGFNGAGFPGRAALLAAEDAVRCRRPVPWRRNARRWLSRRRRRATGEDQKLMAEARARLIQLEQEQAHSLDFTLPRPGTGG
jgi:pSer/pThr/pTyr-binding forkhead associated (FHA) protein